MKNIAWKKDFVVVMHSDYDNTWIDKTIPCTLKQAVKFVYAKRWSHALDKGTVRILSTADWAKLKLEGERDAKVAPFNYDAPYNSQFLGAQPARAGEDY